MLVQWSDNLSVGNAMIDEQHHTLIDKINELHEAAKAGQSGEAMGEIIQFLVGYAQKHFKDEEEYFKSHNWPEAAAHCDMHNKFLEAVGKAKQRFDTEGVTTTLVIEVTNFAADWVFNHIKKADKGYYEYISGQAN